MYPSTKKISHNDHVCGKKFLRTIIEIKIRGISKVDVNEISFEV